MTQSFTVLPVWDGLPALTAGDRVRGPAGAGSVVIDPAAPHSLEIVRVTWDGTGYPVDVARAALVRIATAEADPEDLRSLQLLVDLAKGIRPALATAADLERVELLLGRFHHRLAGREGR
jgi:hypothetical protein